MKKILIVDDEPNIVMSLEYTFKKNNFEVFIARDGQEALDILEKTFPDVIILDVYLKNNSTGIDAAKKIREMGINTPIIFTTGNSYNDTTKLVKDISFCSVLNKPVDFDTLLDLINLEVVS